MQEAGTAPNEKGGTRQVHLYSYTYDGHLLARLIESFDPSRRGKAYQNAYQILQSILNMEPRASHEIFYSVLYKKFNEVGLFGEFVIDRLRESLESYPKINTMKELQYSSLVIFRTNSAEKGKLYLDLWDEAFIEMTPEIRELLLFNMKIDIEQRMMTRAMAPRNYEKYRMENIQIRDRLSMEGYCKNCNLGYPCQVYTREYLKRTNYLPNAPILDDCLKCTKRSLLIPTL